MSFRCYYHSEQNIALYYSKFQACLVHLYQSSLIPIKEDFSGNANGRKEDMSTAFITLGEKPPILVFNKEVLNFMTRFVGCVINVDVLASVFC